MIRERKKNIFAFSIPEPFPRKLLIIDNLNTLSSDASTAPHLPSLLSSFLSPSVSLLALYHADIPLSHSSTSSPYTPSPLTTLKYLATTIMHVHSLPHILSCKRAQEKSQAEPAFGLGEGVSGILLGLQANAPEGVVLELEYRRKSGRGVREWYFLPHPFTASSSQKIAGKNAVSNALGGVVLLEDHPAYRYKIDEKDRGVEEEGFDVTFDLGITERQRVAREGVVLPYFDAQSGGGVGEGGRILYDMGVEDDFDEEEDEI